MGLAMTPIDLLIARSGLGLSVAEALAGALGAHKPAQGKVCLGHLGQEWGRELEQDWAYRRLAHHNPALGRVRLVRLGQERGKGLEQDRACPARHKPALG